MSASRKSGYYWVKYVNQNHWSIEYWNGGMWFTRNSHLVEDSMFSTIDETPIERKQKEIKPQSNCNLPDVSNNEVPLVCETCKYLGYPNNGYPCNVCYEDYNMYEQTNDC